MSAAEEARSSDGGAPFVTFADAEPNGLADLVGRLLESNLRAHPERRELLRPATIEIRATDAGVAAVVELSPGAVTIRNSAPTTRRRDLVVEATSRALLELAAAPLALGYPDPRSGAGRDALRALASRRVRIVGLVRRPGVVRRFAGLLSVADGRG